MKEIAYYVRWRGDVSGPYDISAINEMLENGKISKHHQVSSDKKSWLPLRNVIAETPEIFNDGKDEVAFVEASLPRTEQPTHSPPPTWPPDTDATSRLEEASASAEPPQPKPHPKVRLASYDGAPIPAPMMPAQQRITPPECEIRGNLYVPPPRMSGLAVAGFVMGLIGVVGGWMCCGLIFSILAIVFGHIGHAQVNSNPVELTGRGLAITGFVLGYVSLVGSIIVIFVFGLFATYMEQAARYF